MQVQDFKLKLADDIVPWRLITTNDDKEWAVLWLQGWTSTMDSHLEGVKRMSKSSRMAFATMDYAGHGVHDVPIEKSSRQQQFNEVIGVYDELKKMGYEKIVVVGGSFGGYMAALLAGKRPVHTAVLRAPAAYPDLDFAKPFSQTEAYNDPRAHHNKRASDEYLDGRATVALKKYNGFVYVLEHELDTVIDRKIPLKYFEVSRYGNYLIIPKVDHSPKLMPNAQAFFYFIESVVNSILEETRLREKL